MGSTKTFCNGYSRVENIKMAHFYGFGFKIVFAQLKESFPRNLFQKSLLYYHNKNEL